MAGPTSCTRAYIRALTAPPISPPSASELETELVSPWNVRMPVDAADDNTRVHWREQRRTALFERMFDWGPTAATPLSPTSVVGDGEDDESRKRHASSCVLQPYFSFGSPSSPFFAPWEDVAHCLRHLLLHQIGCRQTSSCVALVSHETDVFLATASHFDEEGGMRNVRVSDSYYLLRCHHDRTRGSLVFGYHERSRVAASGGGRAGEAGPFHRLREVSLADENWRLESCVLLKNLARIVNCLKDYAVPLTCSEKLSLVAKDDHGGCCVQKIYHDNHICTVFDASVENMIEIYGAIADVPHTDKLVSVERKSGGSNKQTTNSTIVCQFAPVGRSYLPADAKELLDALVCVAEALVSLHSMGIMHRDIRWANVFHAFQEKHPNSSGKQRRSEEEVRHLEFSREWVLFDFEFAARSPQPPLGEHTLTPGNHAPEMILHDDEPQPHTAAVDIWGLGYLILHAEVDLPASHSQALAELCDLCMNPNPAVRPSALHCLGILKELQSTPCSKEKDVVYCRVD